MISTTTGAIIELVGGLLLVTRCVEPLWHGPQSLAAIRDIAPRVVSRAAAPYVVAAHKAALTEDAFGVLTGILMIYMGIHGLSDPVGP
jgi:hypothetical protein